MGLAYLNLSEKFVLRPVESLDPFTIKQLKTLSSKVWLNGKLAHIIYFKEIPKFKFKTSIVTNIVTFW